MKQQTGDLATWNSAIYFTCHKLEDQTSMGSEFVFVQLHFSCNSIKWASKKKHKLASRERERKLCSSDECPRSRQLVSLDFLRKFTEQTLAANNTNNNIIIHHHNHWSRSGALLQNTPFGLILADESACVCAGKAGNKRRHEHLNHTLVSLNLPSLDVWFAR